jgi:hypothetical protein
MPDRVQVTKASETHSERPILNQIWWRSWVGTCIFCPVLLLSSPQKCLASEALAMPQIDEPAWKAVEAGEKATVQLDRPLPEGFDPTATINGQTIEIVQVSGDRTILTIRVPAELARGQKTPNDYVLTFAVKHDQNVSQIGGQLIVTVYPRASAEIKSINDVSRDLSAYIHPEETFTIKGSGFYAPEEAIKFYIVDRVSGTRYDATITSVAPDGASFTARFPADACPKGGDTPFEVTMWDQNVPKTYQWVWIENTRNLNKIYATFFALMPVFVFTALLLSFSAGIRRTRAYTAAPSGGGNPKPNLVATLLVDPSTNTYSLSRVQFILWLFALVYAYSFVFVTRAQVANEWSFPDLSGAELAFLISLGTLVGSIATTTAVGPKGAGDLRPSMRDLIVHGGVVALDRVQQLIWTIVAICIMLTIVYGTAGTLQSLPKLPTELLTLMGASSVGYLVGKAARKPGPVVNEVLATEKGIRIVGMCLSVSARVFISGVEQPRSNIEVEKPSSDRPDEFAEMLLVRNAPTTTTPPMTLTVINPDGQDAKWSATPQKPTAIIEEPGTAETAKPVV